MDYTYPIVESVSLTQAYVAKIRSSISSAIPDKRLIGVRAAGPEAILTFDDELTSGEEASLDYIMANVAILYETTKFLNDEKSITSDSDFELVAGSMANPGYFTPHLSAAFIRVLGSFKTVGTGAEVRLIEESSGVDVVMGTYACADTSDAWTTFRLDTSVPPTSGTHAYRVEARLNGATSAAVRFISGALLVKAQFVPAPSTPFAIAINNEFISIGAVGSNAPNLAQAVANGITTHIESACTFITADSGNLGVGVGLGLGILGLIPINIKNNLVTQWQIGNPNPPMPNMNSLATAMANGIVTYLTIGAQLNSTHPTIGNGAGIIAPLGYTGMTPAGMALAIKNEIVSFGADPVKATNLDKLCNGIGYAIVTEIQTLGIGSVIISGAGAVPGGGVGSGTVNII